MSETDLKVELYLDTTWTDISTYVRHADGVLITRGRSDESSTANPSTCRMTLDNTDGRFSARNPVGAYYGLIGRNTPLRVSVPYGESYLLTTQTLGDAITTPDAAVLDIVGDIDIRIDVTPRSWRMNNALAAKYEITGDNRAWALAVDSEGDLNLFWSPDGTLASRLIAISTVPVPFTSGRHAVRATLDVDNGAAGNTVTFYTADNIDGSWTQLGDPVITAGTTSIDAGTAELEVGSILDLGDFQVFFGKIHAFELYSGIAGTLVANPDLRIQTPDDLSFDDTTASPRTWTTQGSAVIDDRHYRFYGEVSSWPIKRDISGVDNYVPIEAAGVTRRLTQGDSPTKSTLYRALTQSSSVAPTVVGYWPMEDPEGTTRVATAISGARPMTFTGTPTFGSNTAFAASEALPVAGTAIFKAVVPSYVSTDEIQVQFLIQVPAAGATNGQIICTVNTTGMAKRFELYYSTGGSLGLRAFDEDNVSLGDTGPIAFAINGDLSYIAIHIYPDGGDVAWQVVAMEQDSIIGAYQDGTPFAGTVGRCTSVSLASQGGLTDTAFGHLSVQSETTSLFDLIDQLNAFNQEQASTRVVRLATEESLNATSVGTTSTEMGYQTQRTLLELLREAETADIGLLYEARWQLGLEYRDRISLYNQDAVLTLDHASYELAAPLNPVDDDQKTLNDITVTRIGGSFSRVTLDEGALSTLSPPDGVGKYDTAVSVSLSSDEDTLDQAGWRLHLGTVDEARYPQIALNLRHSTFDVVAMWDAAVNTDIGDRILIENPPSVFPPDDISQLVQGYTERISGLEHELILNCSPESPYQVAFLDQTALDADRGRIDTDGSELAEDLTTTETDVDVATTAGNIWTTVAGDMPFEITIGGEVMTVTAISGSSSPQTFTVTRSVNGVVKAHSTGSDVRLTYPGIISL